MKSIVILSLLVVAARANFMNQYVYAGSDTACATPLQAISLPDGKIGCSLSGGSTTPSYDYSTCDSSTGISTNFDCSDTLCNTCSNNTNGALACTAIGSAYLKTSCTSSLPTVPSSGTYGTINIYLKSDCSSTQGQAYIATGVCIVSPGSAESTKVVTSSTAYTMTHYNDTTCTTAFPSTTANPNPQVFTMDGSCHILPGTNTPALYYKIGSASSTAGSTGSDAPALGFGLSLLVASVAAILAL